MATYTISSLVSRTNVGTVNDPSDPYGIEAGLAAFNEGDTVNIRADGTYNLGTSQLDVTDTLNANFVPDWSQADGSLETVIRGVNSSDVEDGTRAVITGSDNSSIGVLRFQGNNNPRTHTGFQFRNLDVSNTSTGAHFNISRAFAGAILKNIKTSGSGTGFRFDAEFCHFLDCEFLDGTVGAYESNSNRGLGNSFTGCVFKDSAGNGCDIKEGVIAASSGFDYPYFFKNCLFYNNTGRGLEDGETDSGDVLTYYIDGCVFYNNTGGGIGRLNATTVQGGIGPQTVINSVFANNGGYGIDPVYPIRVLENNLFFSSGTGHFNGLTDTELEDLGNIVNVNPLFTSTTSGSEDFRPQDGSPLIGAGRAVPSA